MRRIAFACAAAMLALGGCVAAPAPAPAAAPAPSPVAGSGGVRAPQVMAPQGLEEVIGAGAAALARRFGTPRLDVVEGDVRKLQFAGSACVLDVYLYPLEPGAEPTATHVAARLRQGGATVDPRACLREIERR